MRSGKKVAITGGIGSGKSYVCRLLKDKGISVYDCDSAAKRLMNENEPLREELKRLVGKDAYDDAGKLNKAAVARFLLKDESNKHAINDLVHPAVAEDFTNSKGQWLESAILFESGFYKRIKFDNVICVAAPLSVRIERICKRDGISREQAMQWIDRQMKQEEKIARSNFVIVNDGKEDLERQINEILNKL